jgi:hypothetical protein
MKKTSNKRLTLDRETLKALVMELSADQLRHAGGGLLRGSFIDCGSSYPDCGCPSTVATDSGRC